MQWFGMLLVVASLVLGSGGVAYRSHASSVVGGHEQFGMTPAQGLGTPATAPVVRAAACPAPQPLEIRLPKRARRHVVSLTNRGYNYRGGLADLSRTQPPASPRD